MSKVKFEIVYNPSLIEKIGDLMSQMDLGLVGVELPTTTIWSWKTTHKVNEKYILKSKRAIKLALKKEGHRLICLKKII